MPRCPMLLRRSFRMQKRLEMLSDRPCFSIASFNHYKDRVQRRSKLHLGFHRKAKAMTKGYIFPSFLGQIWGHVYIYIYIYIYIYFCN